MAKTNHILQYYQKIKDGSITAGRWITLIIEYIIKGLQDKLFFYDAKKANHSIEWIEAHTYHTEGPLAPGAFKLELWQKAFQLFTADKPDFDAGEHNIFCNCGRRKGFRGYG